MTALAPAVEAAALTIEPRPDGGFVLGDPLSGAGVEVRRAAGGRYEVLGESRLYDDAVEAIAGEMRRLGGGSARVEAVHVSIAMDVAEAEILPPAGKAVVV